MRFLSFDLRYSKLKTLSLLKLNYLTKIYSYLFIISCCLFLTSKVYANCSIILKDSSFKDLSYIEINISNKKRWQKNLARLLNKKIYSNWNSDESEASKTKKNIKLQ